jgi:hypothetical protein
MIRAYISDNKYGIFEPLGREFLEVWRHSAIFKYHSLCINRYDTKPPFHFFHMPSGTS